MNSDDVGDILVSKRIEPLILEQLIKLLDVNRIFATSIEEARKKTPVGAPISVFKSNYSANLVMPLLFCASIVVCIYNDRFFNKDDPSDRVKKSMRSNASKKSLLRKYSHRLRNYEKQNSTVPNKSMIMSTVYMVLLKNGIAYFDAKNVSSNAELLKEKQESPLKRQIDEPGEPDSAAASDDKISFSELVEQFNSRFLGKTKPEDPNINKKYEELHRSIGKFPTQFARLITHPISNPQCLELNPIEEGEEGREIKSEEKEDDSFDFDSLSSSPICDKVTDKKDDSPIKVDTKSGGIQFYIDKKSPNREIQHDANRNPLQNSKLAYGQHMDKFEDDIVQWIRIVFKGFKDFYRGTNERKLSVLKLAFNSAISNQLVKDTANGTFYKLLEQPKPNLLPGEDYEITLMLEQLNALIAMVTQSGNNGIVIDVEKGMNIDDPEYISKTVEECGGFSGGMILFLYNLWEHEDGRWLEISKKYVNAIISYGDKLRIRQMRNHNTDNQNGGGSPPRGKRVVSPSSDETNARFNLIHQENLKQEDTQALQHQQYTDSDGFIMSWFKWFKNLPFRLLYKISGKRPKIGALIGAIVPLSLIVGMYWYDFQFGYTLANLFAAIAFVSSTYIPYTAYKNINDANDSFRLPPCIVRNDQMGGGTIRKKSKNTKKNKHNNHKKMSKKINKRTSIIRRRTIKY